MKEVQFTKMHGAGNDYIYIDCTRTTIPNPSQLSIEMSRRHFSVGADGIVLICPSEVADLRMRIFNADGSEAKMCGNATRCIGKYAYEHGLTRSQSLTLETLSGIRYLTLHIDSHTDAVSTVTVDMGPATFQCVDIPANCPTETMIDCPISFDAPENQLRLTAVSMGNPHGVIFTDHAPTDREVLELGPMLECHKMWPDRANIEFCQVIDPHRLVMRVWERGSGETWACGTGACAAAAAAVATGRCTFPIRVDLRGGSLLIDRDSRGHILMEGPAEEVYSGIYKIKSNPNT